MATNDWVIWATSMLLQYKGYEIIAENFECEAGSVPFVATDKDGAVVFVEVKWEEGSMPGMQPSLTRAQFEAMMAAFATERDTIAPIRYDVVCFNITKENRALTAYRLDAFEAMGREKVWEALDDFKRTTNLDKFCADDALDLFAEYLAESCCR